MCDSGRPRQGPLSETLLVQVGDRKAGGVVIPDQLVILEIQRRSTADVAAQMRQKEVALIQPLLTPGDTAGVIGGQVGTNVKRLPSNTYWLGLETWAFASSTAPRGTSPAPSPSGGASRSLSALTPQAHLQGILDKAREHVVGHGPTTMRRE